MTTVAYQGEPGATSHMAALEAYPSTETLACATFEDAFAAFPADAVFLDVGMPGRSGYEVATALRATPAGRDVLLIAVTGWGQPEDRRRTREAGFDRHLVKPPELAAIHAICREIEQRHGAVNA